MDIYGEKVNRLIGELGRLPGIGGKTAQRLAFHIINMPEEQVESLADAIVDAKKHIRYCKSCCTITDQELCPVCASPKRNHKLIMVVETPRDLAAYERVGQYQGVYHVLNGVINPAMGVGVNDIRLKELIVRLEQEDVEELIIATNSSVEGEATAMYISKLVKPSGIKVTRIASGVPVGGDLEVLHDAWGCFANLRGIHDETIVLFVAAVDSDCDEFAGSPLQEFDKMFQVADLCSVYASDMGIAHAEISFHAQIAENHRKHDESVVRVFQIFLVYVVMHLK